MRSVHITYTKYSRVPLMCTLLIRESDSQPEKVCQIIYNFENKKRKIDKCMLSIQKKLFDSIQKFNNLRIGFINTTWTIQICLIINNFLMKKRKTDK